MRIPTAGPMGFLEFTREELEESKTKDEGGEVFDPLSRSVPSPGHALVHREWETENRLTASSMTSAEKMMRQVLRETWRHVDEAEKRAGYKRVAWDVDRPLLSLSHGDLEVSLSTWVLRRR